MRNEIHVKVGGDHGGPSFKYIYQIANLEKPNSVKTSIVINTFEAKDIRSNLELASIQLSKDVSSLQKEKIG